MSWSEWHYLETHHDMFNVVGSYVMLFIGIGISYLWWRYNK